MKNEGIMVDLNMDMNAGMNNVNEVVSEIAGDNGIGSVE